MAAQPSLWLNDEWRALRGPAGRWYFYNRLSRRTEGACPLPWESTDAELDARFVEANPGAPALPPRSAAAEEQSQRFVVAREQRRRAPAVSALRPVYPLPEPAHIGPGTYTHAAGLESSAAAAAFDAALAAALQLSVPPQLGGGAAGSTAAPDSTDAGLAGEWQRFTLELSRPNALFRPETRQLLATATPAFTASSAGGAGGGGGHRPAVAALLAATYRGHAAAASLFAGLLDTYVVLPTAAAVPGALSRAPSGALPSSSPAASPPATARAAASIATGGGGGGSVTFAASATRAPLPSGGLGSAASAASAGGFPGGGVAGALLHFAATSAAGAASAGDTSDALVDAALAALFAARYSPEAARALLALVPPPSPQRQQAPPLEPTRPGGRPAVDLERLLSAAPAWRRAVVALSETHADDGALGALVRALGTWGFYRDVGGARAAAGSLPAFAGLVTDAVRAAVAEAVGAGRDGQAGGDTDGDVTIRMAGGAGGGGGGGDSPASPAHPPPARGAVGTADGDVALLSHTDFGTAFAVHALGVAAARAAARGDDAGLRAALALGRLRQDVCYRVALRRSRDAPPLVAALTGAPLPPGVVLAVAAAEEEGAPAVALPGVREAAARIRAAALGAWFGDDGDGGGGLRADLLPDEDFPAAAAAADARARGVATAASAAAAARTADAASGSADDAARAGGDVEAVLRSEAEIARVGAMCARPAPRATVAGLVQALHDVSAYLLDPAAEAAIIEHADAAEAALAAGDADANGELASTLAGTALLLPAVAFLARTLAAPDVTALMLHVLFAPGVPLDDVLIVAPGGEAPPTAVAVVSGALAWALTQAAWPAPPRRAAAPAGAAAAFAASGLPAALCAAPPGGGGPAGAAAACAGLAAALSASAAALKAGGPLAPQSALASAVTPRALSRPPDDPVAAAAAAAGALVVRCAAYPAVAAGALHFLRHSLLAPTLVDDPRATDACAVAARVAVAVAARWPSLAPSALALLRQALALAPTVTDAGVLRSFRDGIVDRVVDVALGGYALPTVEYVAAAAAGGSGGGSGGSGGWDTRALRRFVSRLLPAVAPPYSLPLALAGARIVAEAQARLAHAAGLRAGAAAGGGGATETVTDGQGAAAVAFLQAAARAHVPAGGAGGRGADVDEFRALLGRIDAGMRIVGL